MQDDIIWQTLEMDQEDEVIMVAEKEWENG
jgi:hypothetical protein